MRKSKIAAFLALLIIAGGSITGRAEEMQDSMGSGQDNPAMMERNEMNRSGQMRGGRPGMNPMMMQQMMGGREQVVATSDGGVVVLAGPKLAKYDAQLNLIKEVEIHKRKPQAENNDGSQPKTDQATEPRQTEERQ